MNIINSNLWDYNTFNVYDGFVNIFYSNILDGYDGEGNISADPMFTDPDNGDFTLQFGSPCIDAGSAYFEYEGEVLVDMNANDYYGQSPDMGAYEYGEEVLTGDLNEDDLVNILDVVVLVGVVLGTNEYIESADLNDDGIINVLDVVILVGIILEL
jgi:hypothetical protein